MPPSTRTRLIDAGMRLFGEQGYAGTSVAQIEAAAGLSPGSGSLYKHFRTKEDLLRAGIDRILANRDLTDQLATTSPPTGPDGLRHLLAGIATAGLARMAHDRDANRLIFRGLHHFPTELARFRDEEMRPTQDATTDLLTRLATVRHQPPHPATAETTPSGDAQPDWPAIATVLVGATAHYWLLTDLFGDHPSGVDQQRFINALTTLAAALIEAAHPSTEDPR